MNLMWLLKAKRWAQNPPSLKKVLVVLAIIAACLAIYGIERMMGGGSLEGRGFHWRRPGF